MDQAIIPPIPMHPCLHLLTTLPPELRNKIYRAALVSPSPICLSTRSRSNPSSSAIGARTTYTSVQEPALLATCRRIRHEALKIFYSENIFFSALRDPIAVWLKAIGPAKASLVKTIRGFSLHGYFDFHGAKTFLDELELWVGREECCAGIIRAGVLQVPFVERSEELKGLIFWLGSQEGDYIQSSRIGVLDRGEKMICRPGG